ncbi:CDP-alcohol phosphatidyltransferase [Actinomyces sp. oral taxon 181 str. F0379]|jgi:hypothetical protein|nr:CDP-alcohol phosphatidyltransferase [Actinomyces sp. oral taxon 181 str. F0379]
MAHIIGGIVLGNHGRSITKAIFTPVARVLVAAHITPNMVTIAGTVVTIAVAVTTFPFGYLWQGALALAVVLFCDSIDGVLARMSGTSSPFGAFLDSTMDRLGDGAVFGSLTAFAIFSMESSPSRTVSIVAGLITIVGAATVSYSRARAESIGVIAKVGIAERTDRLIIALLGAALYGWGAPAVVFAASLCWVAFASIVTVIQRVHFTATHLSSPQES